MKVAGWNVREFNSPRTYKAVTRLLKKHNIDVIGVIETKIEELADLYQILITKFGGWHASHNFDFIEGGRIVVCLNPQTVNLQILQQMEQFIHCSVHCWRT